VQRLCPEIRRNVDAFQERDRRRRRAVDVIVAQSGLDETFRSKRMWMRNTTCMTDYREVQHGFEILRNFFSDQNKLAEFTKALDLSVPGGALEAINLFNQHWDTIRFNTYITSISEHDDEEDFHGRLSMWRAFGSSTAARVPTNRGISGQTSATKFACPINGRRPTGGLCG
jgi:hypothetical protein